MATPTNELEYPGSLEQVRAFMDRLLGGAEGTWTAPNGQILKFYELARRTRPPEEPLMGPPPPSTRATWIFRLLDEEGQDSGQQARIEAYEEGTTRTALTFTDGYEYQTAVLTLVRDPVGGAFKALMGHIETEMAAGQPRKGGRPPKTELTEEEARATRDYLGRVAKGVPKKIAAGLEGHDYATFERWARLLDE